MKKQMILMSMLAVSILSFVGCQHNEMDEAAGSDNSSSVESSNSDLQSERGQKGAGAAAHGTEQDIKKANTNEVDDATSPQR